jgi:hypothetical protein
MSQSAETSANLPITPRRMISSIMNFGPVINQNGKRSKFRLVLCSLHSLYHCCDIRLGTDGFFRAKERNIEYMKAQATVWVTLSAQELYLSFYF